MIQDPTWQCTFKSNEWIYSPAAYTNNFFSNYQYASHQDPEKPLLSCMCREGKRRTTFGYKVPQAESHCFSKAIL